MRLFFVTLTLIFIPLSATAEYRAFELAITNTTTGNVRKVITNLDHYQYAGYNSVGSDETVQIAATWMCWKRSDWMQGICPNPKDMKNSPSPESNSTGDVRAPASR